MIRYLDPEGNIGLYELFNLMIDIVPWADNTAASAAARDLSTNAGLIGVDKPPTL